MVEVGGRARWPREGSKKRAKLAGIRNRRKTPIGREQRAFIRENKGAKRKENKGCGIMDAEFAQVGKPKDLIHPVELDKEYQRQQAEAK